MADQIPDRPLSGIHNRMTIPFFKKKGQPSPISASALNFLVRILRALTNPTVVVQGTKWDLFLTDTNLVLVVPLSSGGGGGGTGNMNYRQLYNSTTTYSFGDVVRVLSGSSQGVFVCVSSTPVVGVAPVFPEPMASGGTNTWDCLALGVGQFGGCAGGSSHTFYVCMTES